MLTAAKVSLQALHFSIGINHSSLIGKCPVLKRRRQLRNLLLGSGNRVSVHYTVLTSFMAYVQSTAIVQFH